MLPQQQRLRRSDEIGTVFRVGKRARHRLFMITYRPYLPIEYKNNPIDRDKLTSRFCFVASKKVGNAVRRNRAKRLMREAIRINLDSIKPGWDFVVVANRSTPAATIDDIQFAVHGLLKEAGLWIGNDYQLYD